MNSHPAQVQPLPRSRKLFVLLAAGSLAVMPGAVIAPVLPDIVHEFHLSKVLAGYLVSAHYLTVAIFSPLLGILADRVGRVRVLSLSLLVFALSGIAGAWTHSFWPMLATRGFLGAATGGIAAASLGILARIYSEPEARSQAIAYASSTLTLANIVYPLLAGWVGSGRWQSAFYLYGLAVPLAVLAALLLREPKSATSQEANPMGVAGSKNFVALLRQPAIWRLLLTLGLTSATAYASVIYLPLYLRTTIHADTARIGTALASQAIGAAVIAAVGVQFLTRRLGVIPTIGVGFGVMALALISIPEFQQFSPLLGAALLFGMGLGLVVPSHYAALANVTPPEFQASILALGTGMNFLGQFLSPTLFGLVLSYGGLTTVFYAAAIIALVTGLGLVIFARRTAY